MIKFKALTIKAKTDNTHIIFLLKKNIRSNIIETILEYSLIIVPELLKEYKTVITSVGQEYKFTERRQDHRTGLEIIYGERGLLIDIKKAKNNYNKEEKP